jgi:hypothetical protein
MWTRLARLPFAWRCPVKWLLFVLVTIIVLYPRVPLLLKHVHHLRNVESLIQPDLPEIAAMNREIDRLLATNTLRRDEFKIVERYVHQRVPYKYDWLNWGNLDYWPTTAEVLERQREDCDGRAVLAASILRARGFQTAHIVANLNHVWVAVDKAELMGPQKEKNLRRVGGRNVVTLPGLQTWLGSVAMISQFPALRSLIILALGLVLAYHPCRNLTGVLAVTTVALIGFVLVLDWGNRLESRSEATLSGQLIVALALMSLALIAALMAGRWVPRIQFKFGKRTADVTGQLADSTWNRSPVCPNTE